MKIVYVARELHYDGIKHAGLSLTRHLSSENEVEVCGAIVPPESPLLGGHLRDELMISDALDPVDVVCMEDEAFFMSLLKQTESQRLERKTSFLVPTNPDIPHHVIQHAVVKNVAALANTDGGHIIIGQADDLTIVGLKNDFAQVNIFGHDGFELALEPYIRNSLHPGWAPLGLRVHWLDHDGLDVAIVEVPKSKAPVYLTDKKSKDEEAVYVRSGTRSDKLTGRELVAWIEAGRSR